MTKFRVHNEFDMSLCVYLVSNEETGLNLENPAAWDGGGEWKKDSLAETFFDRCFDHNNIGLTEVPRCNCFLGITFSHPT